MPDISNTVAWYAALAFGALMVGSFSWSRFDQPSYEDKSQYFRIYAPRFSTPRSRYRNARLGYVAVLMAIFVFFSLFPKFLLVFTNSAADPEKQLEGSAIPLIVATLLMGFQNLPGLKQIEAKIRSALHAFGKIPDGVRRTVSQLKGAQFRFDNYEAILHKELTWLAGTANDDRLTPDLIQSNPVLRRWCKVSCLLDRLANKERGDTRISDSFFDAYDEELESITMRREALALRVGVYAVELMKSIPVDADQPIEDTASARGDASGEAELLRDLSRLRDRLYTYIACGLRSSRRSEGRVSTAMMNLGFDVRPQPEIKRGVLDVAGLFLIVVVSITVFTVFVSTEFNQQYVEGRPWENSLSDAIPVPQDYFILWVWTIFSAAFYLAAVTGALMLRATAIAKLDWFDLDQDDRQRPLSRYVVPIFIGSLCGYVALCLVHIISFCLITPELSGAALLENVFVSMRQSFYWIPLAVIISFFALWVSDAEFGESNWTRSLLRVLVAVLAMTIVGWLISDMNSKLIARALLGSLSNLEDLDLTGFETARSRASLMVAAFIVLLTTLLMVLIQRAERKLQNKESLTGKMLTLRSSDGGTCDIRLELDGTLVQFDASSDDASVLGTWTQYPEGHVIKWTNPLQLGAHWLQGHGVLLREGNTIIFEKYTTDKERELEFVAQVVLKANGAPSEPKAAQVLPLDAARA